MPFAYDEVDVLFRNLKKKLTPIRILALSFCLVIAVGTVLLTLPCSSVAGTWTHPLTALFTATSATCVTGLAVVDTGTWWSLFGQAVILLLIQLGGLGLMTMLYTMSVLLNKRLTLSGQLVLMNALNLQSLNGIGYVAKKAFLVTGVFEGCGALILALRFVPQYGAIGIWYGLFHSISAFCNAGFDLLGGMEQFVRDPVISLTLIALIICSGLGFFVWDDMLHHKRWHRFSFYTRLILIATALLIVSGWVIFSVLEWNNPATLGTLSIPQKLMAALFQSVTLRTAGFSTISQGLMTESSQAVSILYMLVGGGSGSTAGGIKVGTAAVLLLALRSSLTGRDSVVFQGRTLRSNQVYDAMTLTLLVTMVTFVSSIFISVLQSLPFLPCIYETASAIATVGLSTGMTAQLNAVSRCVLIVLMYLGRVGILSFFLAVLTHRTVEEKIKYPYTDVMIG